MRKSAKKATKPSKRFLWRKVLSGDIVSSLMVSIRTPIEIATKTARIRQARTYPITPSVFSAPWREQPLKKVSELKIKLKFL